MNPDLEECTVLSPPPQKKIKTEETDKNPNDKTNIKNATGVSDKYLPETESSSNKDYSLYTDFMTQEELEKLQEFKVLDEVKSNDEDSNDEDSDTSDEKSEGLPEEEIEKMLEEDLPEDFKGVPKPKVKPYITRQKIVLEEKGINHFEALPLDWILVRHHSGMPIYMHRTTRVCTLSKPYFLGEGNTRRHEIPISAIPCLVYRRALKEEEKQKEIDKRIQEQIKNGSWAKNVEDKSSSQKFTKNGDSNCNKTDQIQSDQVSGQNRKCPYSNPSPDKSTNQDSQNVTALPDKQSNGDANGSDGPVADDDGTDKKQIEKLPLNCQAVVLPGGIVVPPPRVETVNTSWKTQQLTPEQINDYCKSLFKFKTVNIMHFTSWAERRKYTKARKTLQYPTLPEGTKLITIPVNCAAPPDQGGKSSKRDWVMNMNGRSYLSVFHEYVRRAMQMQPVYEFKQLENASSPYQATVFIGGMQYGVGQGSSKRQAKSAAARASIHILIPEMREHLAPDPRAEPSSEPDFSFFDHVGIEDPRISEFCAATCEPSPHTILRTCLLRNFGAQDQHIQTEMKKLEYQKIELTMKVGKHSATVVCQNKKTGKQRASQSILQALHPHVQSWGSLLRLYGSHSVKSCKEKKLEEQQITLLQDKARRNEPNHAVLRKLRLEMSKLRERDAAVVPVGALRLTDRLPPLSAAALGALEL